MLRPIALTLCLFPALALADPPPAKLRGLPQVAITGPALTGAEFESYALGKTLSYSDGGAVWGREQYLPGHQVVWSFAEGPCEYGRWNETAGPNGQPMLCFVYEGKEEEQNCWQFFHGPAGLVAQFMEGGAPLSELGQSTAPLSCPGPMVGA